MMPVFVMGLFISILFCGLSVDIGLLEAEKTRMQTAADAAAIAAEMQFERDTGYNGTTGSDGFSAAASYGYTNGLNNTTITYLNNLYTPISSGDYQGHYDAVQVVITRQMQTLFMGLLNGGTVAVSATGIASPPPCLYFMGTKNLVPFTVNMLNTAAIAQSYVKCPAYIGGNLSVPVGSWWQTFQNYLTTPASNSVLLGRVKSGTTFNSPVRTDPLASIAQPVAGATCAAALPTTASFTLNPGTYCGSVNAGVVTPGMVLAGKTVTLNPGLYIVTGGISWISSTVTSNGGVTLFFTNVAGTTKYGTVLIDLNSTVNLSAASGSTLGLPTGGTTSALAGLLFFCDRNWINTTAQDFLFSARAQINGLFYMPSTGLSLTARNSYCSVGYCGIIADNLYIANFAFYLTGTDYTLYPGPNLLRTNSVLVQ